MSEIGEVLVLVEGYDDRAFWAGYLQQERRCTASLDLTTQQRSQLPKAARDRLAAQGGVYTYLNGSADRVIRVVPVQETVRRKDPLWSLFE